MGAMKNIAVIWGLGGLLLSAIVAVNGAVQPGQSEQGVLPEAIRTLDDDPSAAMLWRGIDAMYSYRFAAAAAALDSVIAGDPYNVVAPFVAVANHWLKSLTEQGYQASHAALLQAIDATLPHYEAMIARFGRRADILLYFGSTYGLRARIALADKRWTAVIYSGLKGWRLIRQAHKLDPTLADAYLPIGIFEYYAGMSSKPVQLIARMFGINPDRAAGIQELEQAVLQAPLAWIEAASTLSIVHLYIENNPGLAYHYADLLTRHYPEHYYFNFLKVEALVRTRRLDEEKAFMPELKALFMQSHPSQQLEWSLKFANLEAELAYDEGNWAVALERSHWVIDHYDMEFDWHLGFAYHLRGRIRERQADLAGARNDYRSVVKLDNKTYVVAHAQAALARLGK